MEIKQKITTITDYNFYDALDYKYLLNVDNDFTIIEYKELDNIDKKWHTESDISIPTNFAYEIAKKIVEECERNGYV